MPDTSFGLQPHLDWLHMNQPRRMRLEATTFAEFETWQTALRGEVVKLLGLANRPGVPVSVRHLNQVDRELYTEEKLSLDVGEGVETPIYLLIPNQPPPYKAVLAFHGHDPSVQYILGNYPDATSERENLNAENNYAQALAQAGYLVCAVEQRGMGERLTKQLNSERSCRHLAFDYMLHGRTLLGERCWDGICAINYLTIRPDVIAGRIGCTGHSGGGCTALWLAAIEPRITTTVVSGYFSSFKDSILGMQHCECNYVPSILEWAEMGELAALVAPRPLRLVNGQADTIFPVEAAKGQYETVERAYALCETPEACSLVVHAGGHVYRHGTALGWFNRFL
jgi:hypothetical protein